MRAGLAPRMRTSTRFHTAQRLREFLTASNRTPAVSGVSRTALAGPAQPSFRWFHSRWMISTEARYGRDRPCTVAIQYAARDFELPWASTSSRAEMARRQGSEAIGPNAGQRWKR